MRGKKKINGHRQKGQTKSISAGNLPAEMDFVLSDGQSIIAVEVKPGRMARPSVSRSARSFLEAYAPRMLFVFNQTLDTTITVQDRPVRFVPLEAAIPEIVKHALEDVRF